MKRIAILAMLFFCVTCFFGPELFANQEDYGTYFTRVNIWYEDASNILSTNYHRGGIISVGTKVSISKKTKTKIYCKNISTGKTFIIKNVKKHTNLTIDELFQRYFSSKNILETTVYKNLSKDIKKNIQSGIIESGMSKEAVLMAYGYPPSHRTLSIEENKWIYWSSKFVNFAVFFSDNVVTEMTRPFAKSRRQIVK